MRYVVDGLAWLGFAFLALIVLLLLAAAVGRRLRKGRERSEALDLLRASRPGGLRGGRGDPFRPGRSEGDHGDDSD